MRTFLNLLLLGSTVLLGCKNSEEKKTEPTFEETIQKMISNSTWNLFDLKNKMVTNVDINADKTFSITSFQIVNQTELGNEILQLKGNWKIENDYILFQFMDSHDFKKWTISNDFTKIYHDGKYVFERHNPIKNETTMDELKTIFKFNKKEVVKNIKEIPEEYLGKYQGIQQGYFMTNNNGDEMVINGNKIPVPSSEFVFSLNKNNTVIFLQTNLEDNFTYEYPEGTYRIINENENEITIECKGFGEDYSSLVYVLKIGKTDNSNKIAIVESREHSEPSFTISKNGTVENRSVINDYDQMVIVEPNVEYVDSSEEGVKPSLSCDECFESLSVKPYRIILKKNVVNVNVRDNFIIEESKVLSQVSYPQTFTVIKETIITNDKSTKLYILKNRISLKNENTGKNIVFNQGKSVEIISDKGTEYLIRIDTGEGLVTTYVPINEVKYIQGQKWLYLNELNGWILSEFIEKI